eukprot:scaffold76056_cov70-Phaeocystis_antarctica.AAC.7
MHLPIHLWRDLALLFTVYHVARPHCAELDVRARARLGALLWSSPALDRLVRGGRAAGPWRYQAAAFQPAAVPSGGDSRRRRGCPRGEAAAATAATAPVARRGRAAGRRRPDGRHLPFKPRGTAQMARSVQGSRGRPSRLLSARGCLQAWTACLLGRRAQCQPNAAHDWPFGPAVQAVQAVQAVDALCEAWAHCEAWARAFGGDRDQTDGIHRL